METHHSIEEICQLGRGVIEQETGAGETAAEYLEPVVC